MAVSRPLYLGPRVRRLRRELGLTQQAMAEDLAISPSYIALLERNQRPVTADMLLRLARTYKLDMSDLAADDGEDHARRIADVLRDPLFADIDLPALEVTDLATSFPGISEALLRLHGAYVREQEALAGEQGPPGDRAEVDPVAAVRVFLTAHRNHFTELENAAEQIGGELRDAGGPREWLANKGVRVRFLPPEVLVAAVRRYDRHNEQLMIDETLDGASRAFQVATHIAYVTMRSEIGELVRGGRFADKSAASLARRALAGYGAAALLMPYDRFVRAVDARHYDLEALARQFGASFEQVAHRLTTLSRPGHERVPFFLMRIDEAGNVSKRLDGAKFPFASHGGGCPLWNVHAAFRRPGEVITQWLEYPDGQRFFSLARTVRAGVGAHSRPPFLRALALVCAAENAPHLIYAAGADPRTAQAAPVGIACRLCQRAKCMARAVPPIGRELVADENRRPAEPFVFAEG
jgi:predicted transcriptional regulator/transcriptional regulator with XRE-family HTH domain